MVAAGPPSRPRQAAVRAQAIRLCRRRPDQEEQIVPVRRHGVDRHSRIVAAFVESPHGGDAHRRFFHRLRRFFRRTDYLRSVHGGRRHCQCARALPEPGHSGVAVRPALVGRQRLLPRPARTGLEQQLLVPDAPQPGLQQVGHPLGPQPVGQRQSVRALEQPTAVPRQRSRLAADPIRLARTGRQLARRDQQQHGVRLEPHLEPVVDFEYPPRLELSRHRRRSPRRRRRKRQQTDRPAGVRRESARHGHFRSRRLPLARQLQLGAQPDPVADAAGVGGQHLDEGRPRHQVRRADLLHADRHRQPAVGPRQDGFPQELHAQRARGRIGRRRLRRFSAGHR